MTYNTRIIEGKPNIGVVTPVDGLDLTREAYCEAIKSLGEQGATKVITDLSGLPSGKLTYAYMRPTTEEAPGVTLVYLAGISEEDIYRSVTSSKAQALINSPGITRTLEEAIAKCSYNARHQNTLQGTDARFRKRHS